MAEVRLIAVPLSGALPVEAGDSPPLLREVAGIIAKQHDACGYLPPWVGYVALDGPDAVGLGGFKGPPATTSDGGWRGRSPAGKPPE